MRCYAKCIIAIAIAACVGRAEALRADVYSAPFDRRIHNFGNVGVTGQIHALIAPTATKIIDVAAYDGRDVRADIAQRLAREHALDARVVDMGCGTGSIACALANAGFQNVTGLDTSRAMLRVARARCSRVWWAEKNIVRWNSDVDLATIGFVLHELPPSAISRVLNTLLQYARHVVIIDICPTYTPSMAMLSGEPYVVTYQHQIDLLIDRWTERYQANVVRSPIVPGHVVQWEIKRN